MSKLILVAMLFSGCTSYVIRADCDRTDWYKYGQAAAMEGRRLSGDHKVRECYDAGSNVDEVALDHGFKEGMSNYCQPDTVYATGRKGEFFNPDMCDSSNRLAKKHADGVRQYCQRANGFSAGASGAKYNNICPKELEGAFLPEFNRGRKNYLNATIAANESAIADSEVAIGQLENKKFMYTSELNALPPDVQPVPIVNVPNAYGPDPAAAAAHVDAMNTAAAANASAMNTTTNMRRQQLELQISNLDSDISRRRYDAEKLRSTNRDLRVEMTTL